MKYKSIIDFWFHESEPRFWFSKDPEFDSLIKSRFLSIYEAAVRCELFPWRDTAEGRLAEVIVIDQFSRNLYRDTPLAFAYDTLALALAQEAIHAGTQYNLTSQQKAFLYMPFMHSESPLIHHRAVELFSEPGLEKNLDYELKHKVIIDRFGRYPHRNAILGRPSSPEEKAFLLTPGSSF